MFLRSDSWRIWLFGDWRWCSGDCHCWENMNSWSWHQLSTQTMSELQLKWETLPSWNNHFFTLFTLFVFNNFLFTFNSLCHSPGQKMLQQCRLQVISSELWRTSFVCFYVIIIKKHLPAFIWQFISNCQRLDQIHFHLKQRKNSKTGEQQRRNNLTLRKVKNYVLLSQVWPGS